SMVVTPGSSRPAPPPPGAEAADQGAQNRASAGNLQGITARAPAIAGGVLEGVTPVALTLPGYEQSVTLSRELVTRERAFRPTLLYVTDYALAPLLAAWIAAIALLVYAHREELRALRAPPRGHLERKDAASAVHGGAGGEKGPF